MEGYGLTTSKFLLGLRIHTARLTASPQVRQAVNDMYRYQIPFANSPEMSSDTLMGLLHNARQVALLPLIYGALAVAGHIEAGEYVLAMKASAASGGADFAFAAPVEIHGLITNALTKRREGEQDRTSSKNRVRPKNDALGLKRVTNFVTGSCMRVPCECARFKRVLRTVFELVTGNVK